MDNLDVEIIPQFSSIDECQKFLDSLTEKLNKMEKSKVVNCFRIYSEESCSGFFWSIIPNMSPRKFCFTKLSLAEEFCRNHSNYHSEHYWLRLWLKNPVYHFYNVEKLSDSISYLL